MRILPRPMRDSWQVCCRHQAVIGPPHVSLFFDLVLHGPPFIAASVIAVCVSGLPNVTSNSSDTEKDKVLARVE